MFFSSVLGKRRCIGAVEVRCGARCSRVALHRESTSCLVRLSFTALSHRISRSILKPQAEVQLLGIHLRLLGLELIRVTSRNPRKRCVSLWRGGMATMQCATAAAASIGGLAPIGAGRESSGRKRMQAAMVQRNSSIVSNNRLALLQALSQQAAAQSQRSLQDLVMEVARYVNPPRTADARNLEEALMSVPDLESIPYDLVRRAADYEIRDVKSYVVAETTMSGRSGFDFSSSGQAFNTLAAYLFGKNSKRSEMAMTTPVMTNRGQSGGEKMDMTTPVIQQRGAGQEGQWRMSFVLPAKYNDDAPLPVDSAVVIRRVPAKKVAVAVFSGFVTDDEVKRRELALRRALLKDPVVRVKPDAQPEVAQYNPPFTLPFMRRNEVSLEIEDVLNP